MNEELKGLNVAPEPPPGPLKGWDLYTMALGCVVGTGVVTLIGFGIGYTGYSAWLAYGIAVIWGFVYMLPYLFMAGTFRSGGGAYSLIGGILDERVAGIQALGSLTGILALALYGAAIGQYMESIFPAIPTLVWGIGLISLFTIIQLMGIKTVSFAQNLMFWGLIAALVLFIVVGFPKIQNPIFDFKDKNFMPNGFWKGFFPAVILLQTSCSAYMSTSVAYGPWAKRATRDIPKAMLWCVPSIMFLYVGVGMVASGVLPLNVVANQPLTFVAQEIFPPALFIFFIIGGPILAILTSMNGFLPSLVLSITRSTENGWLPKFLNKRNKHDVAYWPYIIGLGLASLCLLAGLNASDVMTLTAMMGSIIGFIWWAACFRMPKKFPEAWKNSKMHVPNWLYYILCGIGLAQSLFIFYNGLNQLTTATIIVSLTCLALLIYYAFRRSRSGELKKAQLFLWIPKDHKYAETAEVAETAQS